MRLLLLVLLILNTTLIGHAQANYQKATITKNNGEKLQGWINYKDGKRNPESISFKEQLKSSETRTYTVNDISAFEIQQMERFERFKVRISMDKQRPIEELTTGPDYSYNEHAVFLKVIRKGKHLDLFSYEDRIKIRYYVRGKEDEVPVELVYKKYLDPRHSGKQVTNEEYKAQLALLSKRDKINMAGLLELLQVTAYTEKSLSKVVDMVNGRNGQHSQTHKPSATHFYAGIGLNVSKAAYRGSNVLAEHADNKTSFFPKAAVGVDIWNNPFTGRLVFRFDLSLAGAKHEISQSTAGVGKTLHRFDQYTLTLAPQVLYNIYNSSNCKINAGVGIGLNLSMYSNNKRTFDDFMMPERGYREEVSLEGFWLTVPLRIGSLLQKKYEVYAQYNYAVSSITNYNNYAISVSAWQLGFNYHF